MLVLDMVDVFNSLFNYLICFVGIAAVGFIGIMLGRKLRERKNKKEALKGSED